MKTKILTLLSILFIFTGIHAQLDRSKQPKPGPAPKIQLQTPAEFTLSNGLKVLVFENHKLPRVIYDLTIDNVPAVEGEKKGVSDLLSALLGNGTKSISKDDFNEEIDFMGSNISFSSSGGFAYGLSKYSERIMQLMADAVINPLFDETEFKKEKDQQIEQLKLNEKDVEVVAARVALALAYGTHHPSGEFVTQKSLNNFTLDDVNKLYLQNFNPENAYLVIIGDVDFNAVEEQVQNYFGSWKKSPSIVSNTMPSESPNVQRTEIDFVDMPNAVQSNISLMNTTKLKMGDTEYPAILIANHVLGGGINGYLFKNLREKHGYTYGSYSGVNPNKYVSRFKANAEVRNVVTDSAVVQIINEINHIRNEDVDQTDLATAKAEYIGNFVLSLEDSQNVAQLALNVKLNNLPPDYYETYLERINKVTAEDVKKAANAHFKVDNARIVIVGKGSEVLENLVKTGIPIKHFDPYANPIK